MLVPELNQSQGEPCSLLGGVVGLGICCSSGLMCLELSVQGWIRAPIVQCTFKHSHIRVSGYAFVYGRNRMFSSGLSKRGSWATISEAPSRGWICNLPSFAPLRFVPSHSLQQVWPHPRAHLPCLALRSALSPAGQTSMGGGGIKSWPWHPTSLALAWH